MVLRVGGITVVGAANAVLELPEGCPVPPEDQATALVGSAGLMFRVAFYCAVKTGRVYLRDLADHADAVLAAMADDLKAGIAFQLLF